LIKQESNFKTKALAIKSAKDYMKKTK